MDTTFTHIYVYAGAVLGWGGAIGTRAPSFSGLLIFATNCDWLSSRRVHTCLTLGISQEVVGRNQLSHEVQFGTPLHIVDTRRLDTSLGDCIKIRLPEITKGPDNPTFLIWDPLPIMKLLVRNPTWGSTWMRCKMCQSKFSHTNLSHW